MKNLTKAEQGLLERIAQGRRVHLNNKTTAPLALSLSRAGYLTVTANGASLTDVAKRHLGLGRPFADVDPVNWRVFAVEAEAPGFGPGHWLRVGATVTLWPGESLAAALAEVEAREGRRVRLVPTVAA